MLGPTHGWHVDALVAPVSEEKVPAAQDVQVDAVPTEYLPASQIVQFPAPDVAEK
jgi:hypothetical protein